VIRHDGHDQRLVQQGIIGLRMSYRYHALILLAYREYGGESSDIRCSSHGGLGRVAKHRLGEIGWRERREAVLFLGWHADKASEVGSLVRSTG
jgi:hypothetical protein